MRNLCIQVLEKNKLHCQQEGSYLSAVDMEFISEQTEAAVAKEARNFDKNLFILSTVVTLAPFVGLLGTVWGSLLTLSALRSPRGLAGSTLVLEGLSLALATTVVGLLVAIPALVGYNFLKARAREITRELSEFAYTMVSSVELQYRQVDLQ